MRPNPAQIRKPHSEKRTYQAQSALMLTEMDITALRREKFPEEKKPYFKVFR